MSFTAIILMNIGVALVLATILALVMRAPARLEAHFESHGARRRKPRPEPARARGERPLGAARRHLRAIPD